MSMDADKAALLARFSAAFNGNDVTGTEACVTDDFVWVFYEGPDAPDGCILRGAAAGCRAVVERAEQLSEPIEFSESVHYQCGDTVFVTYRARGAFHATGPFDVRAIDIYRFRDGRLASKDTYWKKIWD